MGAQSKAIAGGLAGSLTSLALYALHAIPFIAALPPEQTAALQFVVGAAVGYLLVYLAPANTPASS